MEKNVRHHKFRIFSKQGNDYLKRYNHKNEVIGLWLFGVINGLISYLDVYNEKDLIIEQFTGLQDRKGNDIYEGDVVQAYDVHGNKTQVWQVTFLKGYFAFAQYKSGLLIAHCLATGGTTEIIGTVHDENLLTNL